MKELRLCEKIMKTLCGDGYQRVVLAGEAGIGKTWQARKVSEHATKEGTCYFTIWLHLNKRFDDELSLYENIAFQMEVYDGDEKEWKQQALLKDLKEKISAKLSRKKRLAVEKMKTAKGDKKKHSPSDVMAPYLLLILDDEGHKTCEDTLMKSLGLESFLDDYSPLKLLLTKRVGKTESHATEDKWWDIESGDHHLQKSNRLPAAVTVFAKSLNCITHHNAFENLSPDQENVLKEFAHSDYGSDRSTEPCRYNPTLHLAYQLLETDDTLKSATVDCFWHSLDLFKHCGCVYYRDLITQWILEGYFDPVRSVEKAYKDGHNILLELINRGILKTQEDDMVVPEMAMSFLVDLRHHGLLGRSRLRFSRVYGGDKNKGLGKITKTDDMIKTVRGKRGDSVHTILVSGNRLRLETPKKFFEQPQMKDLEVVGLFDPTMEYLIQSLGELKQLRVLVIRDYDLLSSIKDLKGLKRLQVLEVSGASSLETISDDFFEAMNQLQSLNLSGTGIKSSPSSISQRKNLHSLILRNCSLLEDLPDIQHLKRLEILDVRGACKLIASRNRTFSRLQQLQLLDFSESRLKRLPMFQDSAVDAKLHSLTRLSLHNCTKLVKLPNLRPLSGLQVLDLSGTTSLLEIAAVCFEQKEELKILNLSCTKFTTLPSTISGLKNLIQLLIKDNSNLEVLPDIKGLTSLQVFDVSGCTNLRKIMGSFGEMSYLREVNLSGTRIETLPELPVKNSHICSKLLVLADSRSLIRDTWSQVKEAIRNEMFESLSSSGTQDISKKEPGRVKEKELNESWGFNCPTNKGDRRREYFYKFIYMNTIPFLDITSHQEVLEIQGSHGTDIKDKEALAKAEFVAFVDNTTESLSRIFNDLKSLKGCWLEMCHDIQKLFSAVDEERLRSLEILSITNLRLMDSICSSSSFKNLKKLNLDCCSSIKTLFPDESEPPNFLEVLKIKFCDKLEKVFVKQVEVSSLHTLCLLELPVLSDIGATLPNLVTYKKHNCPNLNISEEDLKSSVS
ncbi:hypothetical protein Bca101_023520 [Brassica carinata]